MFDNKKILSSFVHAVQESSAEADIIFDVSKSNTFRCLQEDIGISVKRTLGIRTLPDS